MVRKRSIRAYLPRCWLMEARDEVLALETLSSAFLSAVALGFLVTGEKSL